MNEMFDYLPHKPPMIMVDALLELSEESVSTSLFIDKNNLFVDNHYFCETGLIENAAQTCSVLVAMPMINAKDSEMPLNLIGYINFIRNLEVFFQPKVNDTIITSAQVVSRIWLGDFGLCEMKAFTTQNDKKVMRGSFSLIIKKLPNEEK
jgi:predicted hotdog family 3-hydroxylacyl-ACP dehydratase